ncbi:MAG: Lrp/AsnC family transcriptional regulator, partial [Sulfolobales archaeon]
DELNKKVEDLLRSVDARDYVILYSKKTLKLSVKYDIFRGISYSEPEEIVEKVPTAEDLGIPIELLKALSYPLPITKNPFEKIANEFRISQEELVDLIKELKHKGVIKDYGATINGEAVGITENAMVLLSSNNIESLCYKIAREVKEATHVVLRESNREWDYLCYFMLHGSNKSILRNVARDAAKNAESYMMLYSLENLKPGIVI